MNARTDDGSWKKGDSAGTGAERLEREGDQLRADMDRTLEQIEQELSPRKLMDRSMEFFRDHGSDFVREAGETVRRNPIPVLLTAAGLVWLTAAVASSRSGSSQRQRSDDRSDDYGSHIDQDMTSFDEFADGQGYATSGAQSGKIQGYAASAAQSGKKWLGGQSGHLAQLVREQPVALGALALAAGALLGAALPMTEYENRFMGPGRNRFSSGASSSGNDTNLTDE